MSEIIVTHAADASARAARVAKKLDALGFKIRNEFDLDGSLSPHARRKRAEEIAKAQRLLVLWSKEAAASPALLDAAARARDAGKLTLVRLDAAAPPASLRKAEAADLSNWLGRDTPRWRALVAALGKAGGKPAAARRAASAPARPAAGPEKKGGALGWVLLLLVLAAAGAGGFYAYTQGMIPGL